jgi:hypothetical protein
VARRQDRRATEACIGSHSQIFYLRSAINASRVTASVVVECLDLAFDKKRKVHLDLQMPDGGLQGRYGTGETIPLSCNHNRDR